MKKTVCIVLLSLCTLLKSDTSDLKLGITANNATLVNILLQNTVLTPNEKQLLLELAHQKVIESKIQEEYFSHIAGLKRKALGALLAGYAVVQTYRDGSVHWLDAICGLCLYASGRDAACKATIEGKIEATKKHANALTIEKLIEQYATDQQPLFALKPSTKCV